MNNNGIALPLAILLVLVVTITSGTMIMAINNEFGLRKETASQLSARYAAEAGIEHGIALYQDAIISRIKIEKEKTESCQDQEIALKVSGESASTGEASYSFCINDAVQINVVALRATVEPYNIIGCEANLDSNKNTIKISSEGKYRLSKYVIDAEISFSDNGQSYKVNKWSKVRKQTCPDGEGGSGGLFDNIFLFGNKLEFGGKYLNGEGATVVLTGDFGKNINGGAELNVSNLIVEGNLKFDGGGQPVGARFSPGYIHIKKDLELSGGRDIYGKVYVGRNATLKDAVFNEDLYIYGDANLIGGTYNGDIYVMGNLTIKDPHINGNVYVHGNLTIGWTPNISASSKIYYKGTISHPQDYVLGDKYAQTGNPSSPPAEPVYDFSIPQLRPENWYSENEYASGVSYTNRKMYVTSNVSLNKDSLQSFENIVIVSTGNITIDRGWAGDTSGVLFAPYGKVILKNAGNFEGLVIVRDGFEADAGGSTVTFKSISEYFDSSEKYPFE